MSQRAARSCLAWLFAGVLLASAPTTADSLDDMRRSGVLLWGADAVEGGAPYVFLEDPANTESHVGFEVDLGNALARELGVKLKLVQNTWDSLVPGLLRGDYHIAMNGIEITEERAKEVNFSTPYFVAGEQLVVRAESYELNTLADLAGKKVGTLGGSVAERILKNTAGIEVVSYGAQNAPYDDLALSRLDAVLMDTPIAVYFGKPNSKLRMAGASVGECQYGVAIKKDDLRLLGEVNAALARLAQSGELRRIYEDWGLWNDPTARHLGDPRPSVAPAPRYDAYVKALTGEVTFWTRVKRYASYLPLLLQGAWTSLYLSVAAMLLAIALGVALAVSRLYGPRPLQLVAYAYVELVRGTPLLIQLYLLYYGLPNLGVEIPPIAAGILGLGLNYAAYEAENYRAGLQSVSAQQMEAAVSLGLSSRQALRHVILPQAVRVAIPSVTNDFIALLKDSSIVSVITIVELTNRSRELSANTFDYMGIGLLTAALYFLMGLPFASLAKRLERRMARYLRSAT